MTRLEALVGLNMVSDIGSIRLDRLLGYFGRPQNIFEAPLEKLTAVSGIGNEIAAKIRSLTAKDIEKEFTAVKKRGLKLLTLDDADYPQWLKAIPGPPIVLYLKGNFKEEDRFSIAIVGSRRASFYGLACAQRFAAGLAARGITVVSGMARGIDTSAHKGALKQGGRTIAVIGSGFNDIYPQENAGLAEEISRSGAVVSEFPMEMAPLRQNFPRRNRIISGLSMGVLVAEAAQNSGALITADFALEQGREVFALPGKVDSATSYGTNGLIKQGAKLVSCVEEILEDLQICPAAKSQHNRNAAVGPALDTGMQQEEDKVYSLIPEESIELDSLAEKTNMDIPKISGILLKLQLKKLIKQLPGKQFIKNQPTVISN
ncbi:MAG: DNA-protecting protein DprA [Candidatus Omnitrophica bacterium]|nr:DNA-protecting protein DprA [Candidatus Omnitrophota bacterium]MBL7210672.1 DNA-protecting protein DprA [Candidatus Omnitrophota bacterium]